MLLTCWIALIDIWMLNQPCIPEIISTWSSWMNCFWKYLMNCCCSATQLCLTLCDPMDCSTPGLSVLCHLLKFAQVYFHCIGDAIQPSHPQMPSSSSALNLSQHRGLFWWVSCLHQMTKILEFQLQHQFFQWVFRVWFPWRLTGLISFLSKGLSGVFSSNWKASILQCFFIVQLSQYMTTGKTIALTIWTFVGRVTSAFQHTIEVWHSFPAKKQTSSDFMAAVTNRSDFGAEEEEIFHYYHLSPPLFAMK